MPFIDENDAIGGNRRPIVVLIECERKVRRELGGSSRFNNQIYGTRAHFNEVPDTRSYYRERDWALDPEKPENMLQLLADHPTFTLARLRKWLASDSFVRSARHRLIQSMGEWGGGSSRWYLQKFNKRWAERVRVVVFGPHIDTDSAYLKRVFKDWFPNATFSQHTGENERDGFLFFEDDLWKEPLPKPEPFEHFSGWVGFGDGGEEEE